MTSTPLPTSLKSEEQLEARKRKFFNETLTLTLSNPATSWKVQRFRLTTDFVQHLIDGTVLQTRGVTLAYLKACGLDEGVGIVVPGEMQRLCKKTVKYEMVLSYPNQTKDIPTRHAYQGQMHFVIRNLPARSQNHLHHVQTQHVVKWIEDGILKEDPDLVRLERTMSSLHRSLSIINGQIQRIHEDPILNDRGMSISGKVAERKRQERYETMLESKYQINDELDVTTKTLVQLRSEKCNQIELSATQRNENLWTIELHGEHQRFNEQILLNKASWNTSFMYAFSSDQEEQPIPITGTSEYLVDTASISIERVEHGFGNYHRRTTAPLRHAFDQDYEYDSKERNCSDRHVDCYHGTYVDGKYQGFGMLYTTSCIYGGGFENHLHGGEGTLIYKDGDVFRSNTFGVNHATRHDNENDILLLSNNRYARGEPSTSKISFSDGASYEGEMQHGTISGQGIYTSASGDRMEGDFRNGVLIKGTIQRSNGDTLQGTFKDGLLHGEGSLTSHAKRSHYIGHFLDGEKHGMGEECFHKKTDSHSHSHSRYADADADASSSKQEQQALAKYWGYFSNNDRSGLGTMEFQDTTDSSFRFQHDSDSSSATAKDELQLDGPWLRGKPIAGGKITNLQSDSSMPTTNPLSCGRGRGSGSGSGRRYRLLNRFKRVEDHKDMEVEKEREERARVDGRFRAIVESKKTQMFALHRNNILQALSRDQHGVGGGGGAEEGGTKHGDMSSNDKNEGNTDHNPTRTRTRTHTHPYKLSAEEDSRKGSHHTSKYISTRSSSHQHCTSTIRETTQSIETKWREMGSEFEGLKETMNRVRYQYNLLEDQWNGINLGVIRERALGHE